MQRTPLVALLGAAGFSAAAAFLLTRAFFGAMPPVPYSAAVLLLALTGLCGYLARQLKARVKEGMIGQDRSQMSPLVAANALVIGRASAWTGALVGGAYGGMCGYLWLRRGILAAAAEDLPPAAAAAVAGLLLLAAGRALEGSCHVPPPPQAEPAG